MPLGDHDLTMNALDKCHNIKTDTFHVSVVDDTSPLAVCLQNEIVVIGQSDTSTTVVPISNLSLAQLDNCSVVEVKGRKMEVSCGPQDTVFDDSVEFCCQDVGKEIMVLIRTTDSTGNANTCMTIVKVEKADSLSCPNAIEQESTLEIKGIITDRYDAPMRNVLVSLEMKNEEIDKKIHTNTKGKYNFEISSNEPSATILPYKNDHWTDGLSTLDAILLQKHLLGKELLKGIDLIAADVNGDRVISGLDLIYLRRLILGVIEKVSENMSWNFVKSIENDEETAEIAEFAFAPLEMAMEETATEMNWTGIKTGDISGDINSNFSDYTKALTKSRITLYYNQEYIDDEIHLQFSIKEPLQLTGFQGIFSLPLHTRLLGVSTGQVVLEPEHFELNDKMGHLTFSYNRAEPFQVAPAESLFGMILQDGRNSQNQYIELRKGDLAPEIYTASKIYSFELVPEFARGNELTLFQNDPNPWKDETVIRFNLPATGEAEISIYDTDGKMLWANKEVYSQGTHLITLSKSMISAKGVLIYKIKYEGEVMSGKMIRVD